MEQHGGPVRVSEERRHSKLGITSVVLAVLATLLFVVVLVVAGTAVGQLAGENPQGLTPEELQRQLEDQPGATGALAAAGFGVLISPVLYLVGLILGVIGLFRRNRKKLFPVLGTLFNGLPLLAVVGLLLLGILGAAVGGA